MSDLMKAAIVIAGAVILASVIYVAPFWACAAKMTVAWCTMHN